MKIRLLVSCLVLAVLAACSGKGPQEPPVATARLSVSHTRVPLGSPVEMKYRFVVSPQAGKIDGDYLVFVHFLEAGSREMMWTDDHFPPVPTSQWKPGQTIEYSRTMFTPVYPYIGEATIELGLYKTNGKRLTLTATDKGHQSYEMLKFELLPHTENVFLIYKDGWHAAEVASGTPALEWQWTKREAAIAFRNPKRGVLFYLHADGAPEGAAGEQMVTVRLGEQVVDTFSAKGEVLRKVPLTAAQLGTAEMAEVRIAVDKTFVPALLPTLKNPDGRELGIRVFHAFVEPQ
jgi:hypothetical protein